MATCRYCGKWSGLFSNEHLDCAQAATKGEPLPSEQPRPRAAVSPLTFSSIVWGVFLGMWLFTLTAGAAYAFLRAVGL